MVRHRGWWNGTSYLGCEVVTGRAASWLWPRLWTDGKQYSTRILRVPREWGPRFPLFRARTYFLRRVDNPMPKPRFGSATRLSAAATDSSISS